MKRKDQSAVFVYVPQELYKVFAKACIDAGITKTEAIIKYLKEISDKNKLPFS